MADARGNSVQRHWFALLVALLVTGAVAGYAIYAAARNVEVPLVGKLGGGDRKKQENHEPPPPSDKLPGAPGPDNTIQTLPPQPGVPAQPPSPIDSEKDPSKKPKEKG